MTQLEVASPVIVTPDRRLRVFVSSTLDLVEQRSSARHAIESLHLTAVMFEAGARPHPPRALYGAYVDQSDVFVAIYSRRYGWTAPGMEVSGLEDEYDLSAGKPRLVYIERDVDREPELARFLDRVRDDGLSYRSFTSSAELEQLLKDDLVVVLTERFRASTAEAQHRSPAPLPFVPAAIVGRDADIAQVAARMAPGDARLVTLVGPGGIGKTRLAIASAQQLAPSFPEDTYFVSLEDLRTPALVAQTIAAALNVAPSDGYPAIAAVADFFGDRRALLLLDNFEQVVEGASAVAELLGVCRGLQVLVTSRAPLRIRGEQEIHIAPLAGPAAAELFVQVALALRPGLELDTSPDGVIDQICRELDGVPLAIELAAAMVRVLSSERILERVRSGGTGWGNGRRDMPERHRTLDATIEWSYDLLDDHARSVFAQLSAFRGGFTLEAAEQVCDIDGDLLGAVASLVEQSLLRTEERSQSAVRLTTLTAIHDFARTRLEKRADRDVVLSRHAQLFLGLAELTNGAAGREPTTLDVLEAELDNVRSAFEWSLSHDRVDAVARAIGESWWFWWMRGYVREGSSWAERCLADDALTPDARARALSARGMLAIWSGDYDVAMPALQEAAETGLAIGDRHSVAYADIGIGLVLALTSSISDAMERFCRAVRVFEDRGDELGAATALTALAWAQGMTRRFDDTDSRLRHVLDRAGAGASDVEVGIVEAALAQFHLVRNEVEAGVDLLTRSLEHLASARHVGSTILTLEAVAEVAIGRAPSRGAVTVLGATTAIRSAMGTRIPPEAESRRDTMLRVAREQLGDDFVTAFQRGSGLTLTDAVGHGRQLLAELKSSLV